MDVVSFINDDSSYIILMHCVLCALGALCERVLFSEPD